MITHSNFNNIKDFISIKKTCPFCSSKLKPILTNFISTVGMPMLKAKLENDSFKFNLKYFSKDLNIKANLNLNIIDNELSIIIDNDANIAIDWMIVKIIFENMSPHIQLICNSRKCKMSYYLSSSFIKSKIIDGYMNYFIINPIHLNMEVFVHNNLWIQNDWKNNSLNIYSVDNKSNPIQSRIIDLESNKDKILNKIMMLVNFS